MTDRLDATLKRIAGKYASWDRLCEYDDMLQTARIAAWKSERTYDSARGMSRNKWALLKAHGAILMMRRREWARRRALREFSYDAMTAREADYMLASRDFAPFLVERLSPVMARTRMTEQKIEILRLLTAEEKSPQEVADQLYLARRTIEYHLAGLYGEWGVKGLLGAYNEAMRRGLIDPPMRR